MLFNRQKILIALLKELGGKLLSTDFQKHLFLYTELYEHNKSYDFVPYRFGCYSFQAIADKKKLIELGYLKSSTDWEINSRLAFDLSWVDRLSRENLADFVIKYRKLRGKNLIKHTYENYPYYAIHSEIAKSHVNASVLSKIEQTRPKPGDTSSFNTLGYEGLSIEAYLNKLIQNSIQLLVDVRKNPISRKYGFSKRTLESLLNKMNINYIHMPQLGISSSDRQKLKTQQDYDRLFEQYERKILAKQTQDLNELCSLYIDHQRIAITCFERSAHQCHRSRIANSIENLTKGSIKTINL